MRDDAPGVSRSGHCHRVRLKRKLAGLLAASVLLGPAIAAAPQPPTTEVSNEPPSLDIEPTVVTKPKDEETSEAVPDPEDVPEAVPDAGNNAPIPQRDEKIRSGDGSAQFQSPEAKRQEVKKACDPRARRLEISSMLGLPGSVGGGSTADWGPVLLAIALASGAVALLVWWRRGKRESRDSLETVSTVVALISAVVGLALTFVPGIAIDQPPPPDAQMTVRQAHARITHGEYARKVHSRERLDTADKREVGNVIWLELRLVGYRDKPLRLQYGAYRARAGGALLPGTTREIKLGSDRDDVETMVVPVWIGYPRRTNGLKRFQAQFRLIDPRDQILKLARTGPMGASEFRYVCSRSL
jgi:hypothetical protein